MKITATTGILCLLAGYALAGGRGDHSHDAMEVGIPAQRGTEDRTIEVRMYETEDGEMLFEPRELTFRTGETVRFVIKNTGENDHEFVLDTFDRNAEHRELMAQFPEMEHDDPNALRLVAGSQGEIVWTFANEGQFEFACLIPGHHESGMTGSINVN